MEYQSLLRKKLGRSRRMAISASLCRSLSHDKEQHDHGEQEKNEQYGMLGDLQCKG
jgi:hypothetical protein